MESIKPDAGKITTGETIVYGYYAQDGMLLKEDKRVIEVVKDIAEFIPLADGSKLSAAQLLTRFQFPPETQYTFVSKLSGGEKRRLYLMTILIKNPNFLILDEPTNDLDILTLSILEEFLAEFKGCVLIVSHDRYFMDRLVDHVFVFEGNGVIRDFPGNYTDWRSFTDAEKLRLQREAASTTETVVPVNTPVQQTGKKVGYKEKREYEQLSTDIPLLEARKAELEQALTDATTDHQKLLELTANLSQVSNELSEKELRWP
jgi:ATP-binding cassette subfamily F protein uup